MEYPLNHEEEAEKIRINIIRNLSFEEKMNQVANMRQLAWDLKAAAIKKDNPDWDAERVEKKVKEFFLYARS